MTYMSGYMQGELLLAADAFLAGVFLAVCYEFSAFSETLQITAHFGLDRGYSVLVCFRGYICLT